MNMVDIGKMTSLSDDGRRALTAAFEAMEAWRDEVSATNDRHLPKLLDQMTAVQRAMGWPPHWSANGREHLLTKSNDKKAKASKSKPKATKSAYKQAQGKPTTTPMPFGKKVSAKLK